MKRLMRSLLMFSLIAMIVLPVLQTPDADAQDDPDLDALVARVELVAENFGLPDNYQQAISLAIDVNVDFTLEDGTILTRSATSLAVDGVYTIQLRDDLSTLLWQGVLSRYQEETQGADVSLSIADLEIESRRIDETVYVNVDVINLEGEDTVAPPDGWFIATSLDELSFTGVESSGLDGVFNFNPDVPTISELEIRNFATAIPLADTVTVARVTLEDGSEVDSITLTFIGENLIANSQLLGYEATFVSNEAFAPFVNAHAYEATFAVDDDNNLRGIASSSTEAFDTIPATEAVGPDVPEGSVFIVSVNSSSAVTVLNPNVEFDPVVAPALEGE